MTYQNTVLRANEEVENALVAFLRSQDQVKRLTESATAAERAVHITMRQYQEGKVDFNRVFDLQIFLAQQQDLQVKAMGEVVKSLINVYRALGGGWQIRYGAEPTGTTEPIPAPAEEIAPPPEVIFPPLSSNLNPR